MKIKIIEENVNALFSRREVKVEVKTEIVPSQNEAKKIITDKFSCDENVVKIRKIEGKFGVQSFIIIADIYDSKEELLRVVKKTKQEIDSEKKAEEEKLKVEIEAKEAEKAAKEEAAKVEEEKMPAEAESKEEAAPEGVLSTEGSEGKEEVVEEKKEEPAENKGKEEKPVGESK